MHTLPRLFPLALSLAGLGGPASAQLRQALVDADVVAVARQVGKQAFSADVDLHHLQLLLPVRGIANGTTAVTVIDWPKLSLHNRPSPRQSRLYCLTEVKAEAARIGLPPDQGPYYRMSNGAGSNPLVGAEPAKDPFVQFAQVLAAIDRGAAPAAATAALVDAALGPDAMIRIEATHLLAERPLLRDRVSSLQWSRLLTRTSGETDDVDYKIALAELCAEQRLDGVVEALVLGLEQVHAVAFARAAGRLCALLRGEAAAQPLLARLQTAGTPQARASLLLAIGATQTGPALDALLQLQAAGSDREAVDAALREHGSRKAHDAVLTGDKAPAKDK